MLRAYFFRMWYPSLHMADLLLGDHEYKRLIMVWGSDRKCCRGREEVRPATHLQWTYSPRQQVAGWESRAREPDGQWHVTPKQRSGGKTSEARN